MGKRVMYLLLNILLSALLYSFAFVFPQYFAVGAILFFVPLALAIRRLIQVGSIIKCLVAGSVWGLVAYGIHTIWLYEMLRSKMCFSIWVSFIFYLTCVMFLTFTAAVWFGVLFVFIKILRSVWLLILFIISCIYFYLLSFIQPFSSPMVPLIELGAVEFATKRCGCLLRGESWCDCLKRQKTTLLSLNQFDVVYLKPVLSAGDRREINSMGLANEIYHRLSLHPSIQFFRYCSKITQDERTKNPHTECHPKDGVSKCRDQFEQSESIDVSVEALAKSEPSPEWRRAKPLILLGAESYYPYSLNKTPSIISFWWGMLPLNSYFLLGSQYQDFKNQKCYQVAYFLHAGRIIDFYVKNHRMLGRERLPFSTKSKSKIKQIINSLFTTIFFKSTEPYSKPRPGLGKRYFNIPLDESQEIITIIPRMCSDFFFRTTSKEMGQLSLTHKNVICCLLVNDSWFCSYFKNLMWEYVRLQAVFSGTPILYVTHEKLRLT
jgi:hypothetical protein